MAFLLYFLVMTVVCSECWLIISMCLAVTKVIGMLLRQFMHWEKKRIGRWKESVTFLDSDVVKLCVVKENCPNCDIALQWGGDSQNGKNYRTLFYSIIIINSYSKTMLRELMLKSYFFKRLQKHGFSPCSDHRCTLKSLLEC